MNEKENEKQIELDIIQDETENEQVEQVYAEDEAETPQTEIEVETLSNNESTKTETYKDLSQIFKDTTVWQWFHDQGFEGMRVNNASIVELKVTLEQLALTIGRQAKLNAAKRGKATVRKEDIIKAYDDWKETKANNENKG